MREAPSYTISFYYRKILVPIDGSETAHKALQVAIDIAQRYGSKLVVVYAKPKGVVEREDPIVKAKERLKELQRDASIEIIYKYIEYDPSTSSPHSAIIREIIEGGYDLVVIGSRGKTLSTDIHLGSVALSVVINAPCSIFIVR
jgi:nucleotide-binding universal stress UspA family protein